MRNIAGALLLALGASSQTTTSELTATLPTSTETSTVTLPSTTSTVTMPSMTASMTSTSTYTTTLPSMSATMTLPSASSTGTMTLPTETSTSTLPSSTASDTATSTLPTGGFTASNTMTMPSGTESSTTTETQQATTTASRTFTMPTDTTTGTSTLSLPSATTTMTQTGTLTLPAHDNYTMALEPGTFYDGQEIRIQLKATLDGGAVPTTEKRSLEMFNVSAMGSLKVRVYAWDTAKAGDCAAYDGGAYLFHTGEFGMSMVERYEENIFVGAAHVTFAAPHSSTKFIICFRHTVPLYRYNSDGVVNKWMLFSTNDGALGQYVFQSQASKLWYHLPDASSGQYAIVQLLSTESWNFTYAPSACGTSPYSEDSAMKCGLGDNLKIVPVGEPCTLEHQSYSLPYLGSGWVQNDGQWDREAIDGLRLGSTAGGVGRFGTQYANPLVDTWSSWGTYYPANEESFIDTHTTTDKTSVAALTQQSYILSYAHHAYAYVRLPQMPNSQFDICFSSREQRMSWRTSNSSMDAVPMWRKLYKCSSTAACASSSESSGGRTFTVKQEFVGWSMYDLTPNTWGTIVFDDKESKLSNEAATSTILVNAPVATQAYPVAPGATSGYTNNANYWAPPGGDYFRIVKVSKFGESTSWSNGLQLGSFPNSGCWDRSLDDAGTGTAISTSTPAPQQGGWVSDGAEYPIGSRDLTGDPTTWNPSSDTHSQAETFATLWVPTRMTRWYVCYRRTCGSASGCTKNSGIRVLPWHDASTNALGYSAAPVKFLHLEKAYSPAYGAGMMAVPLVPWEYGEDEFAYPPSLAWYMNDTREYTYGPIIIEKTNYTQTTKLDSRPWTGVRNWVTSGCANAPSTSGWTFATCSPTSGTTSCDQLQCTEGSALRLVRNDKPCDWPGFIGSTSQGANVTDGGAVECNSADATTDTVYCKGRRVDNADSSTVAFYITVPEVVAAGSGYRVCYRLQGWNWREAWPAAVSAKAWGEPMPSGARQRGDWSTPNIGATQDTSPDNGGVDNWFQSTADARTTMTLAAVEDRAGMEALFIVADTRNELSTAPRRRCPGGCEDSGDLLRLVQMDLTCDVYPSGVDSNGWDKALADDHLSLYCAVSGSGTVATSGLFENATFGHTPCVESHNARALCKGFVCDRSLASNTDAKTTIASGAGDRWLLSIMLRDTPDLYDDIVPYDSTYFNWKSVAGAIELPTFQSTTAMNRYKVCYKQMGTANWVIFNDTWEVQANPGLSASIDILGDGRTLSTKDLKSGVHLLGGELQHFTVTFPYEVATNLSKSVRPAMISSFYAKLVKVTGDDNHCINPGGHTEAQPFTGQTRLFQVGSLKTQIEFYLVTPSEPGQYDLCVQARMSAEDTMSWWRGRRADGSSQSITVRDNGVRYYVMPGNQPTNQAQTIVNLIRCTPPDASSMSAPHAPLGTSFPCNYVSNKEVFNTNPDGDMAKIIPVTQACSDGSSSRSRWGQSTHVGIGKYVSPAQGSMDNLGPADGDVDVAELTVTLPATTSDARVNYKVCVFTSFTDPSPTPSWTGSRKAWVEISQAANIPGQVTIRDIYTGYPAFQTLPSYLSHWTLDTALVPKTNLYSSESTHDVIGSASTALAGAATTYVQFPTGTTASPTRAGFNFYSYTGMDSTQQGYFTSNNLFKLVAVAKPKSRVPASAAEEGSWGKVREWEAIPDASCFSPAALSSDNIGDCAAPEAALTGGTKCPQLSVIAGSQVQVSAHFTVPIEPGKYIVCYKLNATTINDPQPWMLARSNDAMSNTNTQSAGFFYSHPSFLEFEAATPTVSGTTTSTLNLTVHDMRTVVNSTDKRIQSLSSWCSRIPEARNFGVPCQTINSATPIDTTTKYYADLLTIVNDSQVCPTPYIGPDGMGTAGQQQWFKLLRTLNSSVMIEAGTTTFQLPPVKPSTSGQYKICVFKAGEVDSWDYPTQFVAKRGVVYQVWNRGTAASGGATGMWQDSATGVPTQLLVTPMLAYNTSVRFIEYVHGETPTLFGAAAVPPEVVTDTMTGTLSRTPLLRSGSTVEFVVRAAAASGDLVASGSYAVDVYRCAAPTSWDSLQCLISTAKAPTSSTQPYVLQNLEGACESDEAAEYGWPTNGLRQFMTEGTVRFLLQYRSACNGNEFGCGVTFVARPTGLTADIQSLPQWINIEYNHYADAVQLGMRQTDMKEVLPTVSPSSAMCESATSPCQCVLPSCYMLTCVHRQSCTMYIQARYQGPPEFAPAGRVGIQFSELDYTSISNPFSKPSALSSTLSGVDSKSKQTWGTGGYITYTLASPEIKVASASVAYAYLNVTWDGDATASTSYRDWTRVVVKVTRPEPAALVPMDVRAVDLESPKIARLSREPTPRFFFSRGEGQSASVVTNRDGSYLEALVPYEMRYGVMAAGERPMDITTTIGLTGWTLSAEFSTSATNEINRILEVVTGTDGLPVEGNMMTLPAYTNVRFGHTGASSSPLYDGNGWYLRFRVLNNRGCSRFTNGCSLKFTLKKGTVTGPNMVIQSPVRVIGTTMMVTTHDVTSGATSTSAPAWDGLNVRAFAGTPCGTSCFLYDEYHWGDMFALINAPTPTDGATNRDGFYLMSGGETCAYPKAGGGCAVGAYRPSAFVADGATWFGATFTLKPNMPCYNCEFTFHSMGGAGPYTYGSTMYGINTVSFTQDTLALACNNAEAATQEVLWTSTETQSQTFAVTVEAAKSGDFESNAGWPMWWTYVDMTADVSNSGTYQLRQSGNSATTLMGQLGKAGTAASYTYTGLLFQPVVSGTAAPESPTTHTVTFRANGPSYDSSIVGSVPKTMTSYSCSVEVTLRREDPTPAPSTLIQKFVRITSVERATAMCSSTDGCDSWYALNTDLQSAQGGVVVNLLFTNSLGVNDASARNVTVIPAVSPSDTLSGATNMLTFTVDAATQQETALLNSGEPIPSFWNSGTAQTKTISSVTRTFTFGQLALKFQRSAVANSRGSVTMTYDSNGDTVVGVDFPCRDARIKLCGSVWNVGAESLEPNNVTSEVCTVLRLWVRPETTSKKSFFWDFPTSTTPKPGLPADSSGAPQCAPAAGTLLSYSLTTYYEMSSVSTAADFVFIVYDAPIQYVLSLSTQTLVPAGSLGLTNSSLTTVAGPPSTDALAARIGTSLTFAGLRGAFSFYGLNEMTTAAPARVSASDLTDSQASVSAATTTVDYSFTLDTETYASWAVLDEVQYDDECPSKRYLTRENDESYRTYETNTPGRGWKYTEGARVGLPFPIQTVVQIAGDGRGSNNDKRAWTFASDNTANVGKSLVSVAKRSWSGCNDGGTMTTHQLQASASTDVVKILPGVLGSWGNAADIYSNAGVATAWVMFDQPCQACTLELNLCYMGATSAADCLQNVNEALASDARPLLADRTKVTKAFEVENPEPRSLQVFAQRIPAGDDIYVGQGFSVDVEAVQRFDDWVLRSPTSTDATVFVDSEWACGDDCTDADDARYGNGGFLQVPGTDAELTTRLATTGTCEAVNSDQLGTALLWPTPVTAVTPVPTGGATVSFYFTRPCKGCRVRIIYRIPNPSGGEARGGHIMLREYEAKSGYPDWMEAKSVMHYTVMACASQWSWAGRAPNPSARKMRPFSITAWRVDRNRFPTWKGTETATFATVQEKRGNSGAGAMSGTSPGGDKLQAKAVNGAATIRLQSARACYKCKAQYGSAGSRLTVEMAFLTDATQIVMIPFPNQEDVTVSYANTTSAADIAGITTTWDFEAYAADDLGDRAYTAAGPTIQPYQPMWSVHTQSSGKLEVAALASGDTLAGAAVSTSPSKTLTVTDAQGADVITKVTDGKPSALAITNGTTVYNGIPFGELKSELTPPGVGVLQVTGTGSYIPVNLAMTGVSSGAPTRFYGSKDSVVVSFTVPPTHMAVEDAGQFGCANAVEGGSCTINVYAVGHNPGSAATVFQLATQAKGTVSATQTCTNTDTTAATQCAMTVSSTGYFKDGVAQLKASFTSVNTNQDSCTCTVTVTSDTLAAGSQTVSLTFSKVVWTPTKYVWVGTDTLNTPTSGRDVTTVMNRTLALRLQAVDDTGASGTGTVDWSSTTMATTLDAASMDPAACFVQTSAALTRSTNGQTIDVTGYFQEVTTAGTCTIQAASVGTLPLTLSDDLKATVKIPYGLKVVQVSSSTGRGRERGKTTVMQNFTGMGQAMTAAGMPAAVAGMSTKLTLIVVDAAGDQCVGDYHTKVTLTWGRDESDDETSEGGAVSFDIGEDMKGSTRVRPAPGAEPSTSTEHNPFMFMAAGEATLANNATKWSPMSISDIGPLYFIRRAVHLWVEVGMNEKDPRPMLNYNFADTVGEVLKAMEEGELPEDLSDEMEKQVALARMFANATETVFWVPGYPFDMMITPYDMMGRPVMHAEDQGSHVSVLFRAVGIPCIDADRRAGSTPWVSSTCISGVSCASMTFSSLPACGTSGWTVNGTEMEEVEIQGEPARLANVRYTGPREGDVRFMLTLRSDWWWDPSYNFLGAIVMQRLDRICLMSKEDEGCVVCQPHTDPDKATNTDLCPFPADLLPLDRQSRLKLTVGIIDDMGEVVRGDSSTQVTVFSNCIGALAYVGVDNDFVTPPRFRADNGIVELEDLEFDAACGNMSLTLSPAPGRIADTEQQAGKMRQIETTLFEVSAIQGDTPAPPVDPVAPPPLAVEFQLKAFAAMAVTAARAAVTSFCSSITEGEFNTAFTTLVRQSSPVARTTKLQYVCGLPTSAPAGETVPQACKDGSALVDDTTQWFYGCSCCAFGSNAATPAAAASGAAAGRTANALQTDVTLGAKAEVNVELDGNVGSTYNDNPAAYASLGETISTAVAADLDSGNSLLKTQGGAAFAEATGASLGFVSNTKSTPAPPGGANTPKPTASPTGSPTTPNPTRAPTTLAPQGTPPTAPPSSAAPVVPTPPPPTGSPVVTPPSTGSARSAVVLVFTTLLSTAVMMVL